MQRLKDIKIGPRFFGLLGIIFVCIAIVYLVSRAGLNSMISSAKAVQHTHEVINAAGQITQNLLDMETGLRGFMLTGEDDFLAPYYKGLDELQRNINKTKELLADNPKLTYRIGRIEKLANQWVQEIGEYSINLRREVDNGQLPENVLVNAAKGLDVDGAALRPVRKSGKDAMIEIRDLILELITVERNLLEVRHRESTDTARFVNISILCTALIVILISSCFGWFMVNHLKKSIQTAFDFSNKVANGNYYESFTVDQKDEIGLLINNIHRMTDQLRKAAEANKKRQWTSKGISQLNDLMRDENDATRLANNICKFLANYLDAQISTLYLLKHDTLSLTGSYAYQRRVAASTEIKIGEGLVGQAAFDRQLLSITDIPADYARIHSSIGDAPPVNIVLTPILYNNNTNGVIELGSFQELNDDKLDFLESIQEQIGIGFHNITSQLQLRNLLQETQAQAKELAEKTEKLEASQHKLRMQQEELRDNNEELEEKSRALTAQKADIEQNNRWLEEAKLVLEEKTRELELASKYKSEFLANMSHELRTPLNSLLLLSKKLSSNKEGNLTDKQIQNAQVIYNSGNDLLQMINEILDLAKIEAGQMNVLCETVALPELLNDIEMLFQPLAEKKRLDFVIQTDPDVPETINTDAQKLKQILKNLLSNAMKFTAQGSITLHLYRPREPLSPKQAALLDRKQALALEVIDTGLGIPEEKQMIIFEAFQQADGSTSRTYGGTGLGLSISRELSHLLGGGLQLKSAVGKGSTFTLLIHTNLTQKREDHDQAAAQNHETHPDTAGENRTQSTTKRGPSTPSAPPGKVLLLLIETNADFAAMVQTHLTERGYAHLHVTSGPEAIDVARTHPITGIILGIGSSAIEGLNTLDRLKINKNTAHLPIFILSETKESFLFSSSDYVGFLQKPISTAQLEQALHTLVPAPPPPAKPETPVQPAPEPPPPEQSPLPVSDDDRALLAGKTVLVADDNIRNLYALGEELAELDMTILKATNGQLALELLRKHPETDIILMDIMMPVMDGYDAIKAIRNNPAFPDLPIIAITAKAMKEDRKICIDAGADDYLAKPINLDKLIASMSNWIKTQRNP